jgi:hypothetical protein
MTLRRRKSRKAKAVDWMGSQLKSARGRVPSVWPIPLIAAGAGVVALVAAKVLRGGDHEQPAAA